MDELKVEGWMFVDDDVSKGTLKGVYSSATTHNLKLTTHNQLINIQNKDEPCNVSWPHEWSAKPAIGGLP